MYYKYPRVNGCISVFFHHVFKGDKFQGLVLVSLLEELPFKIGLFLKNLFLGHEILSYKYGSNIGKEAE